MSGSSLDGLDIAFCEFRENAGQWEFTIRETACYAYDQEWAARLQGAVSLSAADYLLLHADYGHYIGEKLNAFIEEKQIHYQAALVASHGHTSFHMPARRMTAQLGDGAAIAAETKLPVISDLRAMDIAFGGQGAPIVPIGEKLLLPGYGYFLNIGGIANISFPADPYIAFDICPANRVLNLLASETGQPYDEGGKMAESGSVVSSLLEKLNGLDYYHHAYPKSLANDFGTGVVYPLIKDAGIPVADALRTYSEHIAVQTAAALRSAGAGKNLTPQMLVTGGGAFNHFLIQRIADHLKPGGVAVMVPAAELVNFKEAMIMAFIGVLRWRQENNVLASVTGAARDSIGGALWTGQEA